MAYIAGPYRWRWGNLPLGVVDDAPRLEYFLNGRPINADAVGGNQIDNIFTGITASISFVFNEFNATGVLAAIKGGASNVLGRWEDVGCSVEDKRADVLWGQALPAAACLNGISGAGQTFLAYRATIAVGVPVSWLMGGRLRQVPVVFNLMPYARENAGTATLSGTETLSSPIQCFEMIDGVVSGTPAKADALSLAAYLSLAS